MSAWEAANEPGYDTAKRPWIVRRRNKLAWGGIERALTTTADTRRFATELAAKKVADQLNAAAIAPGCGDGVGNG